MDISKRKQRKNKVLLTFMMLISIYCYSQEGVFIESDDQLGRGIIKNRGNECLVIAPTHVIENSISEILVSKKGMSREKYNVLESLPFDISILKPISGLNQCSFWEFENNIENFLTKSFEGTLEIIEDNGTVKIVACRILVNDQKYIYVKPIEDEIKKGYSGSPFYIHISGLKLWAGMLMNTDLNSNGIVLKSSVIRQLTSTNFPESFGSDNLLELNKYNIKLRGIGYGKSNLEAINDGVKNSNLNLAFKLGCPSNTEVIWEPNLSIKKSQTAKVSNCIGLKTIKFKLPNNNYNEAKGFTDFSINYSSPNQERLLLSSLLIPGSSQYYKKEYLKSAVFSTVAIGSIFSYLKFNQLSIHAENEFFELYLANNRTPEQNNKLNAAESNRFIYAKNANISALIYLANALFSSLDGYRVKKGQISKYHIKLLSSSNSIIGLQIKK